MKKKKILLTGGSGFIGGNILPILQKKYEVKSPRRNELNINDESSVDEYLSNNKFDILIHSANITPGKNSADKMENMLEYTIKAFLNFQKHSDKFEKIFYFGSGAEYDKRKDIVLIKEMDIGNSIPVDPYGLAKYVINQIARGSKNIYNLRIFGCYGPTDAKTKFIRDCIDCCLEHKPITIRQNCYFDYMYVEDLARIIDKMINSELKYHDYNICTGKRIDLLTIAKIIDKKMQNNQGIKIGQEGLNKEYTANNARLLSDIGAFDYTCIEDGIQKQIDWQKIKVE